MVYKEPQFRTQWPYMLCKINQPINLNKEKTNDLSYWSCGNTKLPYNPGFRPHSGLRKFCSKRNSHSKNPFKYLYATIYMLLNYKPKKQEHKYNISQWCTYEIRICNVLMIYKPRWHQNGRKNMFVKFLTVPIIGSPLVWFKIFMLSIYSILICCSQFISCNFSWTATSYQFHNIKYWHEEI